VTPDRLREIIAATGRGRRELARMLGYGSEASLRQAEAGKQSLPPPKADWLHAYAKLRSRLAKLEATWFEKNPPPT
jgi:hypothetical protein